MEVPPVSGENATPQALREKLLERLKEFVAKQKQQRKVFTICFPKKTSKVYANFFCFQPAATKRKAKGNDGTDTKPTAPTRKVTEGCGSL